MPVFQSLRVQMIDRPGALSALGAALAAAGVDIVRLDVVSHEGKSVVDDLYLQAPKEADFSRAVSGFLDDVKTTPFDGMAGDPAKRMAAALGAVAGAPTLEAAREAAVAGALEVVYGRQALLLRATPSGKIVPLAGTLAIAPVSADEPFAGRWTLMHDSSAAFPARGEWAPESLRSALRASWVAVVPCGASDMLMAVRCNDMPFYAGELERLAAYAAAVAASFVLRGEDVARPGWGTGSLNLPGEALLVPIAA
jgi:hypothetical protein